jgi:hypothetical protein
LPELPELPELIEGGIVMLDVTAGDMDAGDAGDEADKEGWIDCRE